MKKQNKKIEAGFTLIEMVVVIGIMGLLMSLVIANFSSTNQKRNLKIARDMMISDLHKAQSYSLSSKDVATSTPASSYGIDVNLSSNVHTYSFFGESNAVPPVRTVFSTVKLPPNVYIKGINVQKIDGTYVAPPPLADTTFFLVPYGRVAQTYTGGLPKELSDTTTIILSTDDNTSTINVIINGISGSVSSQ